jgi:hypothetical protein
MPLDPAADEATVPDVDVHDVDFSNGNHARLVTASKSAPLDAIVEQLGLGHPKALIVVVGGAGNLDAALRGRLLQLCGRGIARAAADANAVLIDGGTESGVMALMGLGVAGRGQMTPLLGVAPAGMVTYPNSPALDQAVQGATPLDPNHSHFVLVPGTTWGSETDAMFKLVTKLAAPPPPPPPASPPPSGSPSAPTPTPAQPHPAPIVTVVVNGGDGARQEVLASVRRRWPVVVVEGSGGLADELAGYCRQPLEARQAVDDPVLAEILADGDLDLFPARAPVEGLARLITQRLQPGNKTLELAWQRFALFDLNAERQQKYSDLLQGWAIWLGLTGTALALIHSQVSFWYASAANEPPSIVLPGTAIPVTPLSVLWFFITLVPISLSILLAASNRFKSTSKWILLRGAAEAIKREIFWYRMRAGIYSAPQTADTTRESVLAERVETAGRRVMRTEVNESALRPYLGPIPPEMYGATNKDDGLSRLTPERYIEIRLGDQLNYYRGKTNRLEQQLRRWQWTLYVMGGLGTLLAAIGGQLWVPLTTAIVASVTVFLEYKQTERTLSKYNQTETDLTNVHAWWVALSPAQQASQTNVDHLVEHTENILENELVGWVQQMRDALAKLREQQSPDGDKPKDDGAAEDDDTSETSGRVNGTQREPAERASEPRRGAPPAQPDQSTLTEEERLRLIVPRRARTAKADQPLPGEPAPPNGHPDAPPQEQPPADQQPADQQPAAPSAPPAPTSGTDAANPRAPQPPPR